MGLRLEKRTKWETKKKMFILPLNEEIKTLFTPFPPSLRGDKRFVCVGGIMVQMRARTFRTLLVKSL